MSSIVQQQASFVRLGRPRAAVPTWILLANEAQFHFYAVVIFSETRFGKLQFQFRQHIECAKN